MPEIIRVLHLAGGPEGAADTVDRLGSALADVTGAGDVIAPTLPGARNGGDVLVRLRADSSADWLRHRDGIDHAVAGGRVAGAEVDRVVGAMLTSGSGSVNSEIASGRRSPGDGPGVYRVLLAKVRDDAPADAVARFEQALLEMPVHVPQIRAWRLSRVAESVGATSWTHAWEQEYDTVDGLLGPYMNHPIHWAHVDRWFDPESPLQLVRERVCHTFCAIEEPVLDVG